MSNTAQCLHFVENLKLKPSGARTTRKGLLPNRALTYAKKNFPPAQRRVL